MHQFSVDPIPPREHADPQELAAGVYRGLRPEEIDEIERIALDRTHFFASARS